MNKGFFWKLARENMKKNRKDYVPYMLTCVGTIAMFYIIYALTFSKSMDTLPEAEYNPHVTVLWGDHCRTVCSDLPVLYK